VEETRTVGRAIRGIDLPRGSHVRVVSDNKRAVTELNAASSGQAAGPGPTEQEEPRKAGASAGEDGVDGRHDNQPTREQRDEASATSSSFATNTPRDGAAEGAQGEQQDAAPAPVARPDDDSTSTSTPAQPSAAKAERESVLARAVDDVLEAAADKGVTIEMHHLPGTGDKTADWLSRTGAQRVLEERDGGSDCGAPENVAERRATTAATMPDALGTALKERLAAVERAKGAEESRAADGEEAGAERTEDEKEDQELEEERGMGQKAER
jgi:hypothetical protein